MVPLEWNAAAIFLIRDTRIKRLFLKIGDHSAHPTKWILAFARIIQMAQFRKKSGLLQLPQQKPKHVDSLTLPMMILFGNIFSICSECLPKLPPSSSSGQASTSWGSEIRKICLKKPLMLSTSTQLLSTGLVEV